MSKPGPWDDVMARAQAALARAEAAEAKVEQLRPLAYPDGPGGDAGWSVNAYMAEVAGFRAKVEQLQAENVTFRAAQKACETCDAPTMAAVAEMREEVGRLGALAVGWALNESAMIAQGIRHYERCSNVTSGDEMPCVRCQRDEARRLLEYLIKWCACRGTGTCVSGYVCTDVDCADARAFLREVGK